MNNRTGRGRVTYRPSKAQGIIGGIAGGLFVILGVTVVIPSTGVFGIIWTLFAGLICGINLYTAFGKKYVGPEIHIEDEKSVRSTEARLAELRRLYDQGLISDEEYEDKRAEILKEI